MREYERAIADLSKALETDETFMPAYVGRGSVYAVQKEYDSAIRDYSRAIELDPKNADAYLAPQLCVRSKERLRSWNCRFIDSN